MSQLHAYSPDVLVCGGGCAGIGAALAAARAGARTLLVERAGFAGGIMTTVGLPFFDGLASKGDNRIVNKGIAFELAVQMGICAPTATHLEQHNPTFDNVERYKRLLDRLIAAESGTLQVLFHSVAAAVELKGELIATVRVANKAGLVRVKPKVVIDCTGDADIAAWAGAPVEKRDELQPLTLHFRIGHVRQTPETTARCRDALIRAHERGDLPMFYGPGVKFMFAADEVYIHAVRVPADASNPEELTRAEMQGRADSWRMFEVWQREVPGFEDAYFISSGPYIGVRETRRIVGQYILTEDDIVVGRRFEDAIATGCWYLDQHPNRPTVGSAQDVPMLQPAPYDIPYGSLVPQTIGNLLVAGRCHSATQLAASSTRVTATATALGEAAGLAAALAIQGGGDLRHVSGRQVRLALVGRGAGPMESDPAGDRGPGQVRVRLEESGL